MLLAQDKQQVPCAPSPREPPATRAGRGPAAGQLFGKRCNRKLAQGGCQLTEAEQSEASAHPFISVTTEKMKVCFIFNPVEKF